MDIYTTYSCGQCFSSYSAKRPAELCCLPPLNLPFAVGDIVIESYGYGWYDGDKRWIVNPMPLIGEDNLAGTIFRKKRKKCPNGNGNCFDKCCTMGFYYVVTAITRHPNYPTETVIHIATKAMSGKNGHHRRASSPRYVTKVENPPEFLLKDSVNLIGLMAIDEGD